MEPSDINMENRDVEACARLDLVESRMSILEESVNKAVGTLMPKVDALLARSDGQGATSFSDTSSPVTTYTSLIEMAKRGDYEALLAFLADTEIDAQRNLQRTDKGDTALHVAASKGYVKAVMVLMGTVVKIDAPGHQLRTPLHCAAAQGHLAVVQRLLFAGAQVDAKDADGVTPLGLAAGQGNRELINLLLQKGAKPNEKAVFMAAGNDHWNLVELFLLSERGFVDVCTKGGDPLIVLAARANRWEVVHLLLERGASATKCKVDEECALAWASRAGHADAVRELLSRGAASNVLQVQGALGMTKSAAVVWAFVDVVPGLVRGPPGEYCLREAAILGHSEALVALLEAGVNVNAKEGKKRDALFYAASNGRLACVRELLCRGADVDTKNDVENTPLHEASLRGHVQCVRELVQRGSGVNSKNNLGNTPLHVASFYGQAECVRALLGAGASTTERNKQGKTPLQVAVSDNVRIALNMQ